MGIDQLLHYRVIDHENGDPQGARVINISEGGLLCEMDRIIPVSSTMWIDLKIPRTRKVQSFVGGVVYAKEGNQANYHQVGVSFVRIQRDARQAVSRYIRHKLRSESKTE